MANIFKINDDKIKKLKSAAAKTEVIPEEKTAPKTEEWKINAPIKSKTVTKSGTEAVQPKTTQPESVGEQKATQSRTASPFHSTGFESSKNADDYINTNSPFAGYRITSKTGARNTGIKGASTNHAGIDRAMPVGTAISLPIDVTFYRSGYTNARGNWIEFKDSKGNILHYQHLRSYNTFKPGQTIPAGTVLAKSGNTGVGSGAHLHEEYYSPMGVNITESYWNKYAGRDASGAAAPGYTPASESGNIFNAGTNRTAINGYGVFAKKSQELTPFERYMQLKNNYEATRRRREERSAKQEDVTIGTEGSKAARMAALTKNSTMAGMSGFSKSFYDFLNMNGKRAQEKVKNPVEMMQSFLLQPNQTVILGLENIANAVVSGAIKSKAFRELAGGTSAANEHYNNNVETAIGGISNKYVRGGAKLYSDFINNTVRQIPTMALALLSGGTSTGAQASIESPAMLERAWTTVEGLFSNAQFWNSYMTMAGDAYSEAKQSGATETQARTAANIIGFINGAIELSGGIETELAKPLGGENFINRIFDVFKKTGPEEALEEGLQDLTENLVNKLIYKKDAPLFSTQDENAVYNPGRTGQSMAMGYLLGAATGTAHTVIGAAAGDAAKTAQIYRRSGFAQAIDKLGYKIEFTDDASIDGMVDKDTNTVFVNPRSKNPFRIIAKHEMTHILENSGKYAELIDMLKNDMPTAWDTARRRTQDLYERANRAREARGEKPFTLDEKTLEAETAADLGEVLKTERFIRNFAVGENMPFTMRVIEFTRDMAQNAQNKLGTDNGWRKAAGLWAEALNDARNTENSTQKKYKLSGENDAIIAYEPEEANKITKISKTFDNYVEGKDITLKEFFNMSRRKTKKFQKLYMGKISNEMASLINKVFMDNGVESDVSGGNFIISNDMFDHIEKGHGINSNETAEKITADNVDYLKNVINKPDSIEFAGFTEQGNPKIVFEKKIDNTSAVYVQFSSANRNGLFGITFYFKGKLKKGTITANNSNNAPVLYTQSDHDQIPFNNSIAQNAPAVKNNIRKSGKNDTQQYKLADDEISVTSDEFSELIKDKNMARQTFVDYVRRAFPKSVINDDTNKEIGISRNGIDKFLSGNISKEKYATGYKIPELIRSARKVGEAGNRKGKTGIRGYEYFYNTVTIDGEPYSVHIRVRNTDMGDKYYGHTISSNVVDIEIEPTAWSSDEETSLHPINANGSNDNVTQNETSVNSNIRKRNRNDTPSQVDLQKNSQEPTAGVKNSKTGYNDALDENNISQNKADVKPQQYKLADPEITQDDVVAIQSVGRKSINEFTSEDINKTESFARKYYSEMGVKSPFFRAWFGDWRANDTTPVNIASKKGANRGAVRNADTGWEINVSGKVFNETHKHEATKVKNAMPYLEYINSIVENAVLLDSYTISSVKAKSNNSVMMHSLYAIADMGSGRELLKLYVEELNDVNSNGTIKRAYQLQNIKKVLSTGTKVNQNGLTSLKQQNNYTVAQLFNLVKSSDINFKPKDTSKAVNEDGAPKIVYHGTRASFNTFVLQSEAEFGRALGDGFYFTENYKRAFRYANGITGKDHGGHIMPVYLDVKNPFYITEQNKMHYGAELADGLSSGKYDGIIDTRNGTYLVFSPNQIKSATENIGTFDRSNADIRYKLADPDDVNSASDIPGEDIVVGKNSVDIEKPSEPESENDTQEDKEPDNPENKPDAAAEFIDRLKSDRKKRKGDPDGGNKWQKLNREIKIADSIIAQLIRENGDNKPRYYQLRQDLEQLIWASGWQRL